MAKPEDAVDAAALAAALADLYAVAPDEFVATRTSLVQDAKGRGDAALAKAVGRLRRPTVAAWVVNAVVRERPDQAEGLQHLGQRMRAAQAQLDAAAMSALRKDRDDLLGRWGDAAVEVAQRAGRPLTPAVAEEVRATLVAALAGEEATQAVLSGHLTRALSYSGFGDVDLSEAVVRTSSGAVLSVVEGRRPAPAPKAEQAPKGEKGEKAPRAEKARKPETTPKAPKAAKAPRADTAYHAEEAAEAEERQRRIEAAREAHAAAVEAAHEAALAVDQARDRADESRWRVEELEAQLKQARAEHRDAEQAATAATRARRAAQVEVAQAERALREAESGRA